MSEIFVNTARKFRPQRFEDVVGQEHITTTLKNAIELNRLHHAFLFCGPRGVGKTTTARILAKTVNCLNLQNYEPCNECKNCLAVLENKSLDIIEIDGASNNSVDDVRKLKENAKYPPSSGKYKMYIVDEVHMLSTSAFNALLKILEEPPAHLVFVFATTEVHKLPSTILSRCQRFEFKRMAISSIVSQLKSIAEKESILLDDESYHLIARKADGSMRDSQSIFDQAVAFCGKKIVYKELADALSLIDDEFYFQITDCIKSKDVSKVYYISQEILKRGYDLQDCLSGLIEHFRNLLVVKVTNNANELDVTQSTKEKYLLDSKEFTIADLQKFTNYIIAVEKDLKFASQAKLRFEVALMQLATMDKSLEIAELISELKLINSDLPKESIVQESNDNTPISLPKEEPLIKITIEEEPPLLSQKELDSKKKTNSVDSSIDLKGNSITELDDDEIPGPYYNEPINEDKKVIDSNKKLTVSSSSSQKDSLSEAELFVIEKFNARLI